MATKKKAPAKRKASRKLISSLRQRKIQDRRWAMERAMTAIHGALFDFNRMGFDLIDALIFASKGVEPGVEDQYRVPSDFTLHQLQVQARHALRSIDTAVEHLRPYAFKRLGEPEEAFAALEVLVKPTPSEG